SIGHRLGTAIGTTAVARRATKGSRSSRSIAAQAATATRGVAGMCCTTQARVAGQEAVLYVQRPLVEDRPAQAGGAATIRGASTTLGKAVRECEVVQRQAAVAIDIEQAIARSWVVAFNSDAGAGGRADDAHRHAYAQCRGAGRSIADARQGD